MKGIIPQGLPWTQNRFSGSIPLKTAKLFKGQGYVSLRSLLNGITYRSAWEFRLRKTPCLVIQPNASFRKWNQLVGSASLTRLRITTINQCRATPFLFVSSIHFYFLVIIRFLPGFS